MGIFNLGTTTGVKEAGSFITPGIHKAKFVSVEPNTITSQKDGSTYNAMKLTVDLENHGEFSHNFFEPTSTERTQSQFGENPSQVEHFLIAVRQILDALDPEIGKSIDEKNVVVNGKKANVENLDFKQLVKLVNILTAPYAGTEIEVKLIPQNNGFAAIPGFPARINKAGALGIATKFIGHNLVLNSSELKKVEAAKNAQPTNMRQTEAGSVDGLADALGINVDEDSDLPF